MKTASFPSSFPSLHTQLNRSLSMQTTQHLSTRLLLSPLSRFPLWTAPFKPNFFQPSVPPAPKLSICRNHVTLSIWYIRQQRFKQHFPLLSFPPNINSGLNIRLPLENNPHRITDLYSLSPYAGSLKTSLWPVTLSSSFVKNSQHMDTSLIHSLVTKYAYMFFLS